MLLIFLFIYLWNKVNRLYTIRKKFMKEFKFIRELFCAHKERMFIGSSVGTVSGRSTYYYACKNCCKAFSQTEAPTDLITITGYDILKDGITFRSFDKSYNLNQFMELLNYGKLLFSRNDMKKLFELYQIALRRSENNAQYFSELASVRESEVILLKSILENAENLIPSPTDGLTDEEKTYVDIAAIIKDHIIDLFSGKTANVPMDIYKPFHMLLSSLMGYEKLRYWYQWENKVLSNGDVVKVFFKRKKKRN